ncbi:MAG: class-IV chitin synthase, partial [Amphiamblys sp. WSBS2006]
RVLLSQRRRWINSTIHNLFELVLVPEMCGVFCFSMKFIVVVELIGTLVLPAAITFTLVFIVQSIIGPPQYLEIALLLAIFILPGLLTIIIKSKLSYSGWMLIYILSLPIWNGVFPLYSYWHFDDFSWGKTSKVEEGKERAGAHTSSGALRVVSKKWREWIDAG